LCPLVWLECCSDEGGVLLLLKSGLSMARRLSCSYRVEGACVVACALPLSPMTPPRGVPVSSPSIVLGPAACACALRRRQLFWPLCMVDSQATWHNETAAHIFETRLPGLGKGGHGVMGLYVHPAASHGPGSARRPFVLLAVQPLAVSRLNGLDRTRRILMSGSPQCCSAVAQGPRCQPRRSVKTPAAHVD
jgi:hypothetical protein